MVAEDDTFALLRVIHNNFYLEPGGRIRFSQPYLGRTFPRFEDYRRVLSDRLAALFAHATHPAPRRPLPPPLRAPPAFPDPPPPPPLPHRPPPGPPAAAPAAHDRIERLRLSGGGG